MSRFTEKLAHGTVPSESDWADYLLEAHHLAPTMTPDAFACGLTGDGENSYQRMARHLRSPEGNLKVVDLACGDGHLIQHLLPRLGPDAEVIGIDMSGDGLAIARKRQADPRVRFVEARASDVPLGAAAADSIGFICPGTGIPGRAGSHGF